MSQRSTGSTSGVGAMDGGPIAAVGGIALILNVVGLYAFPGVASFVTEAAVDETASAVRQLLLDQGWQPYGSAGDVMSFKQGTSRNLAVPPTGL